MNKNHAQGVVFCLEECRFMGHTQRCFDFLVYLFPNPILRFWWAGNRRQNRSIGVKGKKKRNEENSFVVICLVGNDRLQRP